MEAHDLKIKANDINQSLLVVFAAGEEVEELLYYAVLDDIRVHPTKNETVFDFSDMKEFAEPAPHKTDLVLVKQKKNISAKHIHPYSICRTPPVLLGALPSGIKPKSPVAIPELTLKNVLSETCDAIYKATEKRMVRGEDQIFSTEALAIHGKTVQEGRRRRISQKLNEIFQKNYQLAITESEISTCETVENLVSLVKEKLRQKQPL